MRNISSATPEIIASLSGLKTLYKAQGRELLTQIVVGRGKEEGRSAVIRIY